MMTREAALSLVRLPGNTPWESALIQHYIEQDAPKDARWDFNIRIGTALDPGPGVPDSIRRGSILNTQKRIDALQEVAEGVFIVEAKIVLDLPAYGQFEGYRHILERDHPEFRVLGYIAVAHAATPDTVGFLKKNGVLVYLYPDVLAPA